MAKERAKELIDENDQLRKQLTEENKRVYEDMLLYIRTDLRIAEYESEQLLLELLTHMLEAQAKGDDATMIFGDDPKAYADELIAELPVERKRNVIAFISVQAVELLGYLIIVQGIIMVILALIGRNAPPLIVGDLLLILLLGGSVVGIGVWSIFKLIRSDLFNENANSKMTYVKAGLLGAIGFGVLLMAAKFIPSWGIEITIEGWVYLLIGLVLMTIVKTVRMREQRSQSSDGTL